MTGTAMSIRRAHRQRRVAIGVITCAVWIVIALLVTGWGDGLRLNVTPSEPLGLWRIVPLDQQVRAGDLVFICPPATEPMRLARERGYLRGGSCPSGYAPLIKTVVGIEGQRADVGHEVRINGKPIPQSDLVGRDGKGRSLSGARAGVIPAGTVFLHSGFAGSFDSRYFGPMPTSGILGLAQEVWTFEP